MQRTSIPTAAAIATKPMACAFAGMLALAIAMGIGRFAFTPVLPMMLDDAGLSILQGSWLASANYAGYFAGAVSAGLYRLRAETFIRIGMTMIALTTLAMSLRLSVEGWMTMRFLAGMGSAWVLIALSSWSLETFTHHQRPGLSSIVFAGVGVGITAAGLLCIVLLDRGAASFQAWLLLGTASSAATLLLWPVFQPVQPSAAIASPGAQSGTEWNAGTLRLTACYGLLGFGYIIPATFLPVMAKSTLQDPSLFGWSWPLFGLAAAVSTLLVAPAKRFFTSAQLMTGCYFIMAFGVALPAFHANLTTISLAALCVGGTFMVLTLTAMQEAKRIAGDKAPKLIAAMTAAFAAGQIVGPLTVRAVSGGSAFSGPLLTAAFFLLCSGIALAVGKRANSAH